MGQSVRGRCGQGIERRLRTPHERSARSPQVGEILSPLHSRVLGPALIVGFVDPNQGRGKAFHNAAALLETGIPIQKPTNHFFRPTMFSMRTVISNRPTPLSP